MINNYTIELQTQEESDENSKTSSFLELKSDPLFKAMKLGFPVPRQTSFIGKPDSTTHSQLEYCPPGCVVGSSS